MREWNSLVRALTLGSILLWSVACPLTTAVAQGAVLKSGEVSRGVVLQQTVKPHGRESSMKPINALRLRVCATFQAASLVVLLAPVAAGAASAGEYGAPRKAHFELAPEVQAILDAGGEQAKRLSDFTRYATDLVDNVEALDASVAPDVKLHDLEPQGFTGLAGLKNFRRQRNAAFAYDRAIITQVRFPDAQIIEADVCTERTVADTGARVAIVINARNRWVNGMLIERWDSITQLPPGSACEPAPG